MQGVAVGGHNINNLRYADDTVPISESQDQLQKLSIKVVEASEANRLTINCTKTECLVIGKKEIIPRCKLQIGISIIKQIESFKYLGSTIKATGKCDVEIRRRMGIAKTTFKSMGKILKNCKLYFDTKCRALEC